MKRSFYFAHVKIIILSMLLSSCGGGGGSNIRYYLVDPVSTSKQYDAEQPLSIEIIDLRIPQYLERFQIVTRSGQSQLNLSDANQWGENLRKNLLRTISVNLSGYLGTSDIGTPLNRSTSLPDYRVLVHIVKFEQDTDGVVRLSARWQISTEDTEDTLNHTAELESTMSISTGNYDAIVSSMQSLFGELSQRIAGSIIEQNSVGSD